MKVIKKQGLGEPRAHPALKHSLYTIPFVSERKLFYVSVFRTMNARAVKSPCAHVIKQYLNSMQFHTLIRIRESSQQMGAYNRRGVRISAGRREQIPAVNISKRNKRARKVSLVAQPPA